MLLVKTLEWACWVGGLASIAAYVGAFLKNRPHVRPFHALGLLLLGGALLGLPNVVAQTAATKPNLLIYVICLLVASALLQILAAFRKRRARQGDAAASAAPPSGPAPVEAHA